MLTLKSTLALLIGIVLAGPLASAQDNLDQKSESSDFEYRTVTTKEGLTFRVPADMPIETRGGIQAPIPFDEYVYGKFKRLESRFKTIESRMDALEKELAAVKVKSSATSAGSAAPAGEAALVKK